MKKIRISAVSYTNTKPFVYGLEHSAILEKAELSLDIPAVCAQKLVDNQVDIGLVPVAALLDIPGYQIIADYCIGALGAVNSVFIFSTKPIKEISKLRLDPQSRTSNNLAKVLFKHYWKLAPEYGTEDSADAFVEIGDRTFGKKEQFPFVYDLAEEWFRFTGLPFVFAVWASNKPIAADFVHELNAALKYGLDHRKEVISGLNFRHDFDLDDYLQNKISFELDDAKRKGMAKFLYFCSEDFENQSHV